MNGGLKTLSCDLLMSIQNELNEGGGGDSNLTDAEKEQQKLDMMNKGGDGDLVDLEKGHFEEEVDDDEDVQFGEIEEENSICDVVVHREMQQ